MALNAHMSSYFRLRSTRMQWRTRSCQSLPFGRPFEYAPRSASMEPIHGGDRGNGLRPGTVLVFYRVLGSHLSDPGSKGPVAHGKEPVTVWTPFPSPHTVSGAESAARTRKSGPTRSSVVLIAGKHGSCGNLPL